MGSLNILGSGITVFHCKIKYSVHLGAKALLNANVSSEKLWVYQTVTPHEVYTGYFPQSRFQTSTIYDIWF